MNPAKMPQILGQSLGTGTTHHTYYTCVYIQRFYVHLFLCALVWYVRRMQDEIPVQKCVPTNNSLLKHHMTGCITGHLGYRTYKIR